jgi:hypothetical protein
MSHGLKVNHSLSMPPAKIFDVLHSVMQRPLAISLTLPSLIISVLRMLPLPVPSARLFAAPR